jgi:hypothetical protein
MRYVLLCYDDEEAWNKPGEMAVQQAVEEAVQLAHELNVNAEYLIAAPLHSAFTATSVRVRHGEQFVTDGPFTERKEVLDGVYLIDAEDLDQAIGIAARHPGARLGSVEIRRVLEIAAPGPGPSRALYETRAPGRG